MHFIVKLKVRTASCVFRRVEKICLCKFLKRYFAKKIKEIKCYIKASECLISLSRPDLSFETEVVLQRPCKISHLHNLSEDVLDSFMLVCIFHYPSLHSA